MNASAVVIIPARNEAVTIADIVRRVSALGLPILVVDDASGDGTADLACEAGARVVVLPRWLGNMRAIRHGLRHALHDSYDYFITMDADGQHNPENIPLLLEAAVRGNGVILASCPERVSNLRRMAWRWFRFLSGLKTRDLTSGFKVYTRQAASLVLESEKLHVHYQDIPILLLLRSRGLKVIEIPVAMRTRVSGISRVFLSWWVVFRYLAYTTAFCCADRLRVWP
ncbi:MAG: glycosyltransferase family 2 protein [Desulfovibrionaceae bacterium]|nr:glycosyltransferase family 2 protein [Desulfovibrionaceae bacterium]